MSKNEVENFNLILKKVLTKKPVQVIAIGSGKGGVGKSFFSINLAIALAQKNKNVLLFDGDLMLPSIDIMLGLKVKKNIFHALKGVVSLDETISKGPGGIDIICGSNDHEYQACLGAKEYAGLMNAFDVLTDDWDYFIVDTSPGLGDDTLFFLSAAQQAILLINEQPTSIAGTYSVIKLMQKKFLWNHFNILVNAISHKDRGKYSFNKLSKLTDRFLDVQLNYLGAVPYDEKVNAALKSQSALVYDTPNTPASRAIQAVASKISNWPLNCSPSSKSAFFIEKVFSG